MQTSMLVGYTGFVGSNIDASHDFTWRINTKNNADAIGKEPDLLVFSGLRAEKFLANNDPKADLARVREALEQIKQIAPKKLVLISTVDVYPNPNQVDEDSEIDKEKLQAYGKNRYLLEQWVREYKEDALIIRLPGLFGKNIKKNFIYDYIHVIPSMLKEEKYQELASVNTTIASSYTDGGNGFYKCNLKNDNKEQEKELKKAFLQCGFSALNFTDSRSVFQFYPLSRLWNDIQIALSKDIRILNIATQPVTISQVYEYLSGREFVNECAVTPAYYDYKSKYAAFFGGADGYFMTKEEVLTQIRQFVEDNK